MMPNTRSTGGQKPSSQFSWGTNDVGVSRLGGDLPLYLTEKRPNWHLLNGAFAGARATVGFVGPNPLSLPSR